MSVTTETLRIINEVVYRGKGEVAKLKGDLETTATKAQKLNVDWAQMAQGLGLVTGAAGSLGAAYVKLYRIMGEGAQVQATQLTFDNLAASIGSTSDAMLGDLQEATGGMIADMELMQSANQFTAMGLASTSEEAARLSEIGSTLGAAFRGDAVAGMEEFALLLANQSIPRLDSFGISAGAVRTRIAELQEEFPDMTREAAFMQAVLEESETTMGKLGDNSESAAAQIAIFEANSKNAKDEAKVMVTEGLLPTLTAFNNLVTASNDATINMLAFKEGIVDGLQGALSGGVRTLEAINLHLRVLAGLDFSSPQAFWASLDGAIPRIEALDMALQRGGAGRGGGAVGAIIAANEGIEELGESAGELGDNILPRLNSRIRAMAGDTDGLADAFANWAGDVEVANEAVEETTEVLYTYSDAIAAAAAKTAEMQGHMGDLFVDAVDWPAQSDELAMSLFNAADAAGASAGELGGLGVALGLFDEDAAESAFKAALLKAGLDEIARAFAAGTLDVNEAKQAFINLQAEVDGTTASINTATGVMYEDINPAIQETAGYFREATGDVAGLNAELNAIPGEIVVDILIKQSGQFTPPDMTQPGVGGGSAAGNVFPHGGYSMVGEFGPEFVRLPAGAQVISTNRTAQTISNSTTINGTTRRGEQILLQHLRRQSRPATILG